MYYKLITINSAGFDNIVNIGKDCKFEVKINEA